MTTYVLNLTSNEEKSIPGIGAGGVFRVSLPGAAGVGSVGHSRKKRFSKARTEVHRNSNGQVHGCPFTTPGLFDSCHYIADHSSFSLQVRKCFCTHRLSSQGSDSQLALTMILLAELDPPLRLSN